MKIDLILTACNEKEKYLTLVPYYFQFWEKLGIPSTLILISDHIPEFLIKYKPQIILFSVPEIDSAYVSQVVRILYPALFNDKNILITDVDIFPISKKYFTSSIEEYEQDSFVTFTDRYVKSANEFAICYNIANSKTWSEIFSVKTIKDVKKKLIEWYDPEYNGIKNCPGWHIDQKKLYQYVSKWGAISKNSLIVLRDKDLGFIRLNLNRGVVRRNYVSKSSGRHEDVSFVPRQRQPHKPLHCTKQPEGVCVRYRTNGHHASAVAQPPPKNEPGPRLVEWGYENTAGV